jgi:hypothetical protein
MNQYQIRNIIPFILLISMSIWMSCGIKKTNQNQEPHTISSKYTMIVDRLYKDTMGSLWFKTTDVSDPGNPLEKYIDQVWSDSFENGETRKMKEVIDSKTFVALEEDYYKDKNNIYYFHDMSDGGSLRIIDVAEPESFLVYKGTSYAKDRFRAYYKGTALEGVDLASFKPIILESDGRQIRWYARDNSNYYNGIDIMTTDEIELLISELDTK